MENHLKIKEEIIDIINKSKNEIQLDNYIKSLINVLNNVEIEKNLNSKIAEIKLKIKNQFPKVYANIDEMAVADSGEQLTEIMLNELRTYYDSLNSILGKQISDHPNI